MSKESELYHVLEDWIDEATEGKFEKFPDLRTKFGRLEKDVFGDVPERVKNPVAMQYDRARNNLLTYSGQKDPKYLELAKKHFSEIQNPEH